MRTFPSLLCCVGLTALTLPASLVCAATPETFAKFTPNSAKEPVAKSVSLAASAHFLDAVAVNWTQARKCATCHTNVVYLMARPSLRETDSKGTALVRRFFEDRVAHWDDEARSARPRNDAEVVVTAVALAFHDAQTTGKLHPLTRKALDRMWTRQQADGAWNWEKCSWPPFEHDDYFGAVFATLGTVVAPGDYASADAARRGLAKLTSYFRDTPAPSLHHRAWLLWAARKRDGLMTAAQREQTIKDLLALQHKDGGWSLSSLGAWQGFDGREKDSNAASDGYGTGFVVYVLRQAGLPRTHDAMKRGLRWLGTNQRVSGRWFTPSLNTNRAHYITHAGTAFAVMALQSFQEK